LTTLRELNIGPAREQELGAVLDLWEIARSSYSSTPDNPEVLARLIDRDTGALLVARRGGRVAQTTFGRLGVADLVARARRLTTPAP